MNKSTDTIESLFGGIKFLSKMYATNVYLGAVMTAIFVGLWIAYVIFKKQMEWKEALMRAADGLKKVSKESTDSNDNTDDGDTWET